MSLWLFKNWVYFGFKKWKYSTWYLLSCTKTKQNENQQNHEHSNLLRIKKKTAFQLVMYSVEHLGYGMTLNEKIWKNLSPSYFFASLGFSPSLTLFVAQATFNPSPSPPHCSGSIWPSPFKYARVFVWFPCRIPLSPGESLRLLETDSNHTEFII